jgi:hypothetical protein
VDELEALTSRHRLPSFASVWRFESCLGGLRWPSGGDGAWAFLGVHATLVRDDELGGVFWDDDTDEDFIQGMNEWPRVRVGGRPAVPAGVHGSTMLYLDEPGNIIEHDRSTDEVVTVPRQPVPYVESLLLHLERRRIATERRSYELWTTTPIGPTLADALGLEAAGYASDAQEAWWEDHAGESLLVQSEVERGLRLTTTSPALLDVAAERLGRLGVPFFERGR